MSRVTRMVLVALCLLTVCACLLTACGPDDAPTETDALTLPETTADGMPGEVPTEAPSDEPNHPTETDEPDETEPLAPDNTQGPDDTKPTPPPVITLPPVETAPLGPDNPDHPADETLPYDPSLHPGDSAAYEGVLISAVYGTGKKGAEALIPNGFVQLANISDRDISLAGASLYYKTDGAAPFVQFAFPENAVIPAGGVYLVRANAPADFAEANAVMKIDRFDAEWDVYIDNKEVRLLLAPSGWSIGRDEDITVFDDAVSCFVATESYHKSVYAVTDLSRNKIAVRTALKAYSGYHLVNINRATTSDLRRLCPKTSSGEDNTVVGSRLNEVRFSHDAGVYTSSITLTLEADAGYTIYYTTDGSDPSNTANNQRRKYAGGIALTDTSAMTWGPVTRAWRHPESSKQVGGRVIKACATNGTTTTPVYTNTYFITDDIFCYGVSVISISMPKDEIMGDGFYANYWLSGTLITDPRPRGVGIMEVFDPNGNRVGNSRVEMAVSGNGSSGAGMKSLRIYYKGSLNHTTNPPSSPSYPDAGLESDLNYDIFGGRAVDAYGQAITSFSRLLLRNSGNDCGHSYIRDAYMQRVSAGLNVDTMASATTLVFINGEFWGVYNMRERYSPEYVESHYGVNKDNVVVIESDYSKVHTDQNAPFVVSSGEPGDADPFNAMVDYMRTHNLSNQADYDYVASLMDMDSFIDMWAIRLYFNARDWPENNIKVWRNKNPDDPSGMDTKWHFALLDMDMGFSYFPRNDGNNTSENANFWGLFVGSNSVCGSMMRSLMNNEGFKNQFITRCYEIIKEHFTADYLTTELKAMISERDPMMKMQQGRWRVDGAYIPTWQSDCADMLSFTANRQGYALSYFLNYFGITEDQIAGLSEHRVTVSFHSTRADVLVNGDMTESGTVIKFEKDSTVTLTVKATAKEGYIITGISYTDKHGNKQAAEGATATFEVSESGTLSVFTARANQDPDEQSEGTLVAGASYLFYLTPNGDLYAWGDNRMGVLGLGHAGGTVNVPTYVMSGVLKVVTSSGNDFENGSTTFATAILTADGQVLTVGSNSAGQLGRNGTANSSTLGKINFSGKVVDVSMGHDHLLILDENGTLWGVGSNTYGALGSTGVGGNRTSFTRIADNVVTMSAGRRSTVYLTEDGRLWGLGDNRWNKMSLSHGAQIHTPVVIATNIIFVDSGEHQILAVDGNGKLYYAGWRTLNGFRQGSGNNPIFAAFSGVSDVMKADIYCANMVLLTETGDAYVYGLNTDNGIGSSAVTSGTPKKILSGVADVAAGYGFTAYLMEDGRILVQGNNSFGQAGNGTIGGVVNLAEVDL